MRNLQKGLRILLFRWNNRTKEKFVCPVCAYRGPFEDVHPPTGVRKHAKCPNCGSLERHRLQHIVLSQLFEKIDTTQLRMLHFAPETFFQNFFGSRFGQYETADLHMKGVDHKVDIQHLPFADSTYDVVFASHVLEHIANDEQAIAEIRRILKPKGIAILPVPIVAEKTIEYPEPNPHETYHVRSPGLDYFDRYSNFFSRVELSSSDSFSPLYQLYIYEDRTAWPTPTSPLRPPMQGEKHLDTVPICYV